MHYLSSEKDNNIYFLFQKQAFNGLLKFIGIQMCYLGEKFVLCGGHFMP